MFYPGFSLAGRPAEDPRSRLLAASASTLTEQVRQAQVIIPALISAVKHYAKDYLFAGKFGAPPPALLAACKHISPNNDAQERAFGIVDFRVHKHPNETTEMTDARLKAKINKPEETLESLAPAERDRALQGARKELKSRLKTQKTRREEFAVAKRAAVQQAEEKNEKKTKKKEKKANEFKAVEVARTKSKLDDLLRGTGSSLGKQIITSQIKQLTGVHGVSSHILPLTKDGKKLEFEALYANLTYFLSFGDPTHSRTEELCKEDKQRSQRKRGRPKKSTKARKRPRTDETAMKGDDEEWIEDE